MGFFSKREDQEPSYSRDFVARYGVVPRKMVLLFALISRFMAASVGAASSWGQPLDGVVFDEAQNDAESLVAQERSLLRQVARDTGFWLVGWQCLDVRRAAALESIGLSEEALANASTSPDPSLRAAADAFAVARTINARADGHEPASSYMAIYNALYEDQSDAGDARALGVATWAGIVEARLQTSGRAPDNDVLGSHAETFLPMAGVGWYPNPQNPGEVSGTEVQFERWWNGTDWTDRVRMRQGRGWQETQISTFIPQT